jgi:hypothetical protein
MKDNTIEEILDPKGNSPLPRPISARKCKCGCGHSFYPYRKDNIYLNKQHADFAYNHGKRKLANQDRVRDGKILYKNDNILHKYFKNDNKLPEIERFYDALKADGFESGYFIGESSHKGKEYYMSHRYMYCIFLIDQVLKINIKRR